MIMRMTIMMTTIMMTTIMMTTMITKSHSSWDSITGWTAGGEAAASQGETSFSFFSTSFVLLIFPFFSSHFSHFFSSSSSFFPFASLPSSFSFTVFSSIFHWLIFLVTSSQYIYHQCQICTSTFFLNSFTGFWWNVICWYLDFIHELVRHHCLHIYFLSVQLPVCPAFATLS